MREASAFLGSRPVVGEPEESRMKERKRKKEQEESR